MDEVARVRGEDKRAVEGFLSAVKTLSELNNDPEFYNVGGCACGLSPMQKLLEYLQSTQPGPISDTTELASLLAGCWDQFDGSNTEGMAGDKLLGRMEDVVWDPPMLSFGIERHGRTILGSTRAELQKWKIDVTRRSATCQARGHRQLSPMQPKLDVQPIAEEIVRLIVTRQKDEQLKWNNDGTVHVLIEKILPEESAVKQTLEGRRKRLRQAVEELLSDSGWQKVRTNVYTPSTAS